MRSGLAVGHLSQFLGVSCMTILIGSVLANLRDVWEGRNAVCTLLLCTQFRHCSVHCFHVLQSWHRLAVMSVQDELICVRLVMPHFIFSMQLFLSEIVKF